MALPRGAAAATGADHVCMRSQERQRARLNPVAMIGICHVLDKPNRLPVVVPANAGIVPAA